MTNQYPDVLSILEAVAATPGKNDKVSILEANKDNVNLKMAFHLAYNGLISFYIKKLPAATKHEGRYTLTTAMALILTVLSQRQKTGNAAIEWVQHLLEQCTERDAEVVRRVILRDLRIGASDGSAEKVWPGLIPSFAVMLATSFSDKALAKIKYPAYAQLKSDGSRTQSIVDLDQSTATFWTRKGNEVFLSKETADQMVALFPVGTKGKWVVDGEVVSIDANGVVDRATGNGIYNTAIKGNIEPQDEAKLHFQVWDLIPYDAWQAGIDKTPYKERLENLKALNHDKFTSVIETHVVNSLAEAKAIYVKYIEQDLEGIILKNLAGPWENKRSKDQVKFKQVLSADLEVVEVMPGKAGKKYAEVAGALRCKTRCGQLLVDASGMTDAQRQHFWNKRDEMVGEIVELEYNGIVKRRGSDVYSLFLPVFVKFREDKTVANSLEELQESKSEASLK